jgi:NRAMP (natural resistance-associated macrophage protein)-like metal ion transporter
MNRHKLRPNRLRNFWKALGPGLITGASDDDPSAIITFSQAGARYGLATLWLSVLAFPVLAVLQEMCARIGIVTGKRLTGVIKSYYPPWVLYLLIILSCPAFLVNIGADIAILGEAGNLLFPSISALYCSVGFTIVLFLLILILPYSKLSAVMKFICLSLLLYIIVPFLSSQKLLPVLRNTIIPTFHFTKDFLLTATGLIGAIISPYLFFWQTSSEVENSAIAGSRRKKSNRHIFFLMRKDILSGAFFAVLIMYFIILTTGTILHDHNIFTINTIKDAELALTPLAGNLSSVLFSVGIIGTGFLIIPVLSSSISYILTESFNRKSGLNMLASEAKLFYIIIGAAMMLGIAMYWLKIPAIKALLFTTVLYGVTAPFLIGIVLHICNNKKIMGKYCNNRISNLTGMAALLLMLATVIILGYYILVG